MQLYTRVLKYNNGNGTVQTYNEMKAETDCSLPLVLERFRVVHVV